MGLREKKHIIRFPEMSKKNVIIIVCAIIVLAFFASKAFFGKKAVETAMVGSTDIVTRGDVEVIITGSAAVEPNERFEIISMVSGDIIESSYDVGDAVNEGDVLYQFDTSSTDISMQKQRLSLEQSEMNYNNALDKKKDLVVTAPCSGVISGMDIEVDEDISAGTLVAEINNSHVMEVVLAFNESQIANISVGDEAEITSSANMSSMTGRVVEISSSPSAQSDGSKLYDAVIEFDNPGAIMNGQTVGGAVNGMISPSSGTVTYSESGRASASVEGTATHVYYKNGDYVEKGATLIKISSDTVENNVKSSSISYKNAQLSLREQEDKLSDYSITSPISGTVITKNAKAGDTIDKTNSSTVLMVVADVSKLKFSLDIDELDVSKVKEGQVVEITCDALPGEMFYGNISTVSVEGVATNGVTTYSAEVIIEHPGNLRPSMNVDASVIVESVKNVLRVPTSDIRTAMGRSFVFVKDDGRENSDAGDGNFKKDIPKGERPDSANNKDKFDRAESGERFKGADFEKMMPSAPEGFKTVEIITGISGEDFTEVKSGISEGQEIYSMSVTSSGRNIFGAMGGMSGGMGGFHSGMGGGMPGGMSGRMPGR